MFKKILVIALTSAFSLSAFAVTPQSMIAKSKTLKGLKRGIEADHGMKCGKVERIELFTDESQGFPMSKFKGYLGCSALELNEDGDRNALVVEVSGVVGDGMIQVESMTISWAG